jgi:outer membrane receptor protein involved in Fe transport
MRKFTLLGGSALRSAAFIGLSVALASPSFAQGTPAEDEPDPSELQSETEAESGVNAQTGAQGEGDTAAGEQTITVTGSRIRRPNLESTVPITSLGGESILQGGDTNIGESLNELPQLRSTFAQQNPGLGIGIAGLNLLDLRGLGTQRTLVLVNGRRHVPADILNNAVSVDVNTIPNDLIERVDIVTGGNSAIYGSDAIAGVVNFVLRRNFNGLQVRGNVSIPEAGFGAQQYVSAMYGMNFGGDRGNITLHGEYAYQERIFASDIPWRRQNDGLAVIDADSAGLPNNSDAFPDRTFVRDLRSATIHYAGLIPINQRSDNAATPVFEGGACGNSTLANNGGTNSLGAPFSCTFIFSPDGRLIQQTGARFGTGINGTFAGGNGQTGREGQTVSVLPFLERYNFNTLAHYSFSDAFEIFAEAKWNRVNALGNNAGPSFIQTGNIGDFRERPRIDTPFLNAADRTFLANQILASNCNPDLAVQCPFQTNIGTAAAPNFIPGNLTAAQRTAIANGSYRILVARNLLDVGLRDERFQRDTWRVVGGLRGTFWDDWSYEISANYGKFREDITTNGFVDRQRFSLAMDSGLDPATGTIRCRSQFDPTAAVAIQRANSGDPAVNAARLAADIAACVPYNPFGTTDNSASAAYFSREFTAHSGIEQLDLTAFVSGDTSSFFELPGGPIRFALGAEYRKEEAFYTQDEFVTNGYTNGVSIAPFGPATTDVEEVFGEIQIPILKDMPFFHELTLSGAARLSRYPGAVGSVWAYNAGVDWAPVRDLRFRGNYSRSVRAPNVSETAFPLVPNFAPGFLDPCNPAQRGQGSVTRAANCATDLGALLPLLTDIAPSLAIVSGSSPDLQEETADSWTFGAVIQPRWIPGLSLSIDYYKIRVNDVIASLSAQQIVNSCYDAASLDNVFCAAFQRNLTTSPNAFGDQPGRVVSNSLIVAPLNFARREREGIDVNFNYRTKISNDVRLETSLIYTHNLAIANFQDSINPDFENRILGEVGDPEDEFRLDIDLTYKEFTLGYRMRYVGKQLISTYEDQFPLNGLPPGNADFADILEVPVITYSDLRFEWNIPGGGGFTEDLRFYFGVENMFDRKPPLGLLATGAGPGAIGNAGVYDIRGRTFFGGFRARF